MFTVNIMPLIVALVIQQPNPMAFRCPANMTNYVVQVSHDLIAWQNLEEGVDYSAIEEPNGLWGMKPYSTNDINFYRVKGTPTK